MLLSYEYLLCTCLISHPVLYCSLGKENNDSCCGFFSLFNLFILPGPEVDLSARGMQKLDPNFTCSEDTHTLILDRNNIMKLDHLERSPGIQQVTKPSV